MDLQWYRGIKSDLEAALNGKKVVLHSDRHLCRILSYQNGEYHITTYPSKEKLKIAASSQSFKFNNIEYCDLISYNYLQFQPEDEETIKIAYRKYCDNDNPDVQFDEFINSLTKMNKSKNPLVVSEDRSHAVFNTVITQGGRAVGTVDIIVYLEKTGFEDPEYRVCSFNKSRVVDQIFELFVRHGNPPLKSIVVSLTDNLLSIMSNLLKTKSIEFKPTAF